MNNLPKYYLAKQVITLLQDHIALLGYQPLVHFEFEGCYKFPVNLSSAKLNFKTINQQLKALNIDGELVAEYWKNQWEYVSNCNGQSPLKEADNLAKIMAKLPLLFSQQGVSETLIKPVVWSGDSGKIAKKGDNIFVNNSRIVHIPNAVQINVSIADVQGYNLVANSDFGEHLQQCFLQTSARCCLLYLPEEEAFDRLDLTTRFGLAEELCSPNDISGGHQGSIALYREIGKHNQAMGVEPLLYDQQQKIIVSQQNWQKTARIEHRLGASSKKYDPYINVVFALLNIIDALQNMGKPLAHSNDKLPKSLYKNEDDSGAIAIFEQDQWFNQSINQIQAMTLATNNYPELLGDKLKDNILKNYLAEKIHLF